MNSLMAAISFLTIIPLNKKHEYSSEQMTASMTYYPLVGIMLAGLYSSVYILAIIFLPHLVACALVLAAMAILTGCLHLDGLADTCDGLAGGRNKEDILRIMKDSSTGAAGVVGVVILMLVKFSVLAVLKPGIVPLALVLSLGLSRWSLTAASHLWPYARSESGTAGVFAGQIEKQQMVQATLMAVVISLFVCKLQVFTVWVVLLLFFWLFNRYMSKRIGGITGDTLGALSEVCETVVLLLCAAFVF